MTNKEMLYETNKDLSEVDEMRTFHEEIVERMQACQEENVQLKFQISQLTKERDHWYQQAQQTNVLSFNPDRILDQFKSIQQFTGSNNHSLITFIKTVEMIFELCGSNQELKEFGTRIIKTYVLRGEAEKAIRKLGNDSTWEQIKKELSTTFKPERTYLQVFNKCRYAKACNLKELLDIFRQALYDISDIYEYDQRKPEMYNNRNVEPQLVDLLIDKIDPSFRIHIKESKSITEIYETYAELKLLSEPRAIAFNSKSRSQYQNESRYRQNDRNVYRTGYHYDKNFKPNDYVQQHEYLEKQPQQNINETNQNSRQPGYHHQDVYNKNYYQHRQTNFNNGLYNKQSNNSTRSRETQRSQMVPMETEENLSLQIAEKPKKKM